MGHTFSEIKIQELPAMRVMSCRVISPEPEDDSTRMLGNWLAQHGLSAKGRRNFGFDSQVSMAEAQAGLRGYESAVVVPEGVKADDGIQERLYGGGMYAVMTVINAFEAPFDSILSGWNHLSEWVHNSPQWDCIYGLCYEEVVAGKTGNDLILYHPVKERK
ncbi:MAG TPA: GyrI-like domain-containing protein [Longilinea sp.]|nr:GyrI-like domain-containing protein [Longilinea sp.]